MGRLHFSGFIGWVIWLFIHIGFLTGFRSRFGALLSWWLAFTRDLRRERTFTTMEVDVIRDAYAGLPSATAGTELPSGAAGTELPSAGTEPSTRPG